MSTIEMLFPSTRRSWLIAAGGLILMLPVRLAAVERSQFNGEWELNESESDNAKEKVADAMEGSGQRRGGLLRRGGSDQIQQALERMAEASKQISLQVEGDDFTIESGGRSRTLAGNGETKQQQGERGSIEVKSQWQGDKLVSKAKTSRGMAITSTYSLSSDAKKLYVTREIEGSRLKEQVVIRAVYDRKV